MKYFFIYFRKRQDSANYARCLAEDDWKGLEEEDNEDIEADDTSEQMEVAAKTKPKRKKKKNYYKDQVRKF